MTEVMLAASLFLASPAAPAVSAAPFKAPSKRQLIIAGGTTTAVLGGASVYFYARSGALYDDARALILNGCGGKSCLMEGTEFRDDASLQLDPNAADLEAVRERYARLAQGQQLNRSLMMMTSILAIGASVLTAASLR
jgi:hypothetical protein